MKKNFVGVGALIAAAAAIPYLILKKRKNKRLEKISQQMDAVLEAPKVDEAVDFKDENHLIFCDESNLGKRLIQLDNSINIRDLGGYTGHLGKQVKWGMVIRSEELAHLSADDVKYFEDMDLKNVYDFRDENKTKRSPDRLPATAAYHNLPILDGMSADFSDFDFSKADAVDKFMQEVYGYMAETGVNGFTPVFKAMTDEASYPLLFHCTNGKDRTGFLAALILMICGVPENTVISDYSLTNLTFDEAYEHLGTIMAEEVGHVDETITKEHLREFFGVKPKWLRICLDYIDENYNNVDDYLVDKTGVTYEDLEKIRSILLEEDREDEA